MAARFRADLKHLEVTNVTVRVAAFVLQEGYSTGWGGTAVVVARQESPPLISGTMMSAVMASGVVAGTSMELALEVEGGMFHGATVRTWPCVVSGLRPFEIDQFTAGCNVHLVDPVSFLADQPIWGAYRAVSAGEMIGGALSMAAGGDGKPTLSPVLPRLPSIRIVEGYRDALKELPYALAVGQPLGEWLADFLAMLGLRAELHGRDDGVLEVFLSDSSPKRGALNMSVVSADGKAALGPDSYGPILIRGHSGFPGSILRGGLLDDPSSGSARPLVKLGAVGAVLTGPGLDVDEASDRVYRSLKGAFTEMLMLSAASRQPRLRPGELVRLSEPVHQLEDWQVMSVSHTLRRAVYDNDATLIRGDEAWYPELPLHRPPVFVTGVVDGGNDFDFHQPVPRDRLGHVKVTFPFTPTPVGQEALELAAADTDNDRRITLADFDEEQVESFTSNRAQWEAEEAKYQSGDYNDPFPGKQDDELTAEEQATRDEYSTRRQAAVAYMAYKKAVALDESDADRDGVVSARDQLISDELSRRLRDEELDDGDAVRDGVDSALDRFTSDALGGRLRDEELDDGDAVRDGVDSALDRFTSNALSGRLRDEEDYGTMQEQWEEQQEWEARPADEQDATVPEFHDDPEQLALVKEYGDLFGKDEREDLEAEVLAARKDAENAPDRWPPRIPLPVIEPMAGALHGFITAHRHGDICRVAVHDPFSAEIVGFQYRDDRKINVDLADAVAGLVVEHNYSEAWSGLVFRRTEAMEDDRSGPSGDPVEDESPDGPTSGGPGSDGDPPEGPEPDGPPPGKPGPGGSPPGKPGPGGSPPGKPGPGGSPPGKPGPGGSPPGKPGPGGSPPGAPEPGGFPPGRPGPDGSSGMGFV